MTTSRKKDPAGLLGSRVTVTLDGATDDLPQAVKLLRGLSPAARIQALRQHPDLAQTANELAARLVGPRKNADIRLMHDIAQAELRALYLAAAPRVLRDNARQAGTKSGGVSSAETRAARAGKNKRQVIAEYRKLIATGDRDSNEAIQALIVKGFARTTIYRYLKGELNRIGRSRKNPSSVKRKKSAK